MNVTNEMLQKFVGGLFYFRFPCLEVGPDWHYLLRSEVLELELSPGGSFQIKLKDFYPNRFQSGEWVNHDTKMGEGRTRVFQVEHSVRNKNKKLPHFSLISDNIVLVEIDISGAEAVLYAGIEHLPDDVNVFEHFQRGFEAMGGLGSVSMII